MEDIKQLINDAVGTVAANGTLSGSEADNLYIKITNILEQDRATGRTTRLIDYYVQRIFEIINADKYAEYNLHILDHWKRGNNVYCNKYLIVKILQRIINEHSSVLKAFTLEDITDKTIALREGNSIHRDPNAAILAIRKIK